MRFTSETPSSSVASSVKRGVGRVSFTSSLLSLFVLAVLLVSASPASASTEVFGVESFTNALTLQNEAPATVAGSHPYAMTTTFTFNHRVLKEEFFPEFGNTIPTEVEVYGDPKNIEVGLPRGVVADPLATPVRCSEDELESSACPNESAVGTVVVGVNGFPYIVGAALYSMITPTGVPAQFAANLVGIGIIVHINGRVRTGGDYGLSGVVTSIQRQHQIYQVVTTLWGNPSDPSHNTQRGLCDGTEHVEECPVRATEKALLSMPTACPATPPAATLNVESWQHSDVSASQENPPAALSGCAGLRFEPAFEALPETTAASSPTGLEVGLRFSQDERLSDSADAYLDDAVVTLPAGMTLNPSTAGGREGCTAAQIGLLPGPDERQALTLQRPAANTFSFAYEEAGEKHTSAALPAGASAAQVQEVLEALPSIGAGNVRVSELSGGWSVEFDGALAGREAPLLTGAVSDDAQQSVTITATGGEFQLSYLGHSTPPLPYYVSDAQLTAALQALPGIGAGNVVVTGRALAELQTGARSPLTVTFLGALAGKHVETLTALSGSAAGTGELTSGSDEVTALSTARGAFHVGDVIAASGIPAGTTVTEVNGTTLVLSAAATASGSGVAITANPLTGTGAGVVVSAQPPGEVPLAVSVPQQADATLYTPTAPECPNASKLGTAEVTTPLLDHPLPGTVYLAAQQENPFHSLLAMYLVVDDPATGVIVKLAGHIELGEPGVENGLAPGQIRTSFSENPELPVESVKLDLWGGPRGPLATPAACGEYATTAALTPWSSDRPLETEPFTAESPQFDEPSSKFTISQGCGPQAFAPSFTAGTSDLQAAAFTPFNVTFSRQDTEQSLSGVSVTAPPGLSGVLRSVVQCPEPQASKGECGPESLVGETSASVGVGPDPYWVTGGKVYLTGPYNNGPFGLSIVIPTTAGPFTLTGNGGYGREIIRASIRINPSTAQVTTVSDPLPTMIQGVPTDIRTVNVSINRPGFLFNPTSCSQLEATGTITSTQNTAANVSTPFEAANCANLPFAPKLTASVAAHASKADGTTFDVRLESAGIGQANIHKVDLQLPEALPSRLTTLQKACLAAVFESNPASCSPESIIGKATIHTPLLNSALSGPAYLVSHGGAAFPDVEFVLQGEGVTLILDGKTDIKHGITYSKFETAPDAPFTTFETELPAGPHSILTAYSKSTPYDLCGANLQMPTEITGQNGAVIRQTTAISVTGCPKAKTTAQSSCEARRRAEGLPQKEGL